jgi:hypothetical protein
MPGTKTRILMTALLMIALFGSTSCSTAPRGPQPGTPAFYWQAATETFAARDYLKTVDHLGRLTRTEGEFTARALPWRLVLTAGLSKAYIDLGEEFDAGVKANVFRPMPLRRVMSDYRTLAERRAMEFGEAFMKFEAALKEQQTVALEFPFPTSDVAEIQDLKKIRAGSLLPEATMLVVDRKMIERSITQVACAAVGALGDTAKAQTLFQAGPVQVPREVFLLAMAGNLYDQAKLFVRTRLDKPDRLKLFADEAFGALKLVKENKQTRDLTAKFQKLLQDSKSR